MSGKIVITNYKDALWLVLFKDNRAVEIRLTDAKGTASLVGNLYVGKVRKIQKNLNAAFIEIEDHRQCYYSIAENKQPLYTKKGNSENIIEGDELIVQVERDGIKTKLPYVKSEISFTGQYLVLTSGKSFLGFSGKLSSSEKERIKSFLNAKVTKEYGFIVRTNASGISEEDILAETDALAEKFQNILSKAAFRTCFSRLDEQQNTCFSVLQDFYLKDYEEIITNLPKLYDTLTKQNSLEKTITLYSDPLLPLNRLYSFEKAFDLALERRVWLNSGGYLVIEPTEALTVIDVNTGKYDGHKQKRETILKINLEAAKESARQLRLRNISGIIIIDFINMDTKEDQDVLTEALRTYLHQDPVKTVFVDFTALGLAEITRKKVRKSLLEQINNLKNG